MNSPISKNGIELAISNLNYRNTNSPKFKFINAIKEYYDSVDNVEEITSIDAYTIIDKIWGQENIAPEKIRSKLKNFNSIKSAINSDLDKLFDHDMNPEGLTIGPLNTFEMSDNAKDKLLTSFTDAAGGGAGVSLDKISDVLSIVNDFLSNLNSDKQTGSVDDIKKVLELVKGLTDKVPDAMDGYGLYKNDAVEEVDDGETEDVDEDEIEEIDEDDIEEIDEDEVEKVDDGETEDVDEDEIEEIDEDDIEEIDEDELGLSIGLDEKEHNTDPNTLAEQFDGFLGAMERHYNQYLSIPEGKYTIGSSNHKKNELPIQEIILPEFYMGKYPITNALFEIFIEQTGYKTTAEKQGFGTVYYGRFKNITDKKTGYKKSLWHGTHTNKRVEGAFWYQPGGPGTTLHNKRSHPVVQVSIEDAVSFASWTGKRLPTEFEWEGAARTQQGNLFPWDGNQWDENNGNFEKSAIADTTPVDYYKNGENTYGLADLLGNTLEWTSDETRPPFVKFQKSIFHIAKSSSWLSENNIKLTIRHRLEKNFTSNILSFRCVAD